MVSILWATIAMSLGLLLYLALPIIAGTMPVAYRLRIGGWHFGLAQRAMGQTAVVRRVLGGYDIMPFSVDDEEKVAQVTLDSGMVSDDKTLPFKDPDNRIKRFRKKPLAVVPEGVPAVVDGEVSEVAHWTWRHDLDDKFESQDICPDCDGSGTVGNNSDCQTCVGTGQVTVVNPYLELPDESELRFVDPMDSAPFITKSVEPEWLSTVKTLTKKRFELYGEDVGPREMLTTFIGFALGVGSVIGLQYVHSELLDQGPTAAENVVNKTLVVLPDLAGVIL